MKIEINALVTIRPRGTNTVIEGVVVKYQPCEVLANNGVVWVEATNGDRYKFFEGWDDIEIHRDQLAENMAALEAYIEANGARFRSYSGYGDARELVYYIDGLTYTLVISALEGGFAVETIHQERKSRLDDMERATANARIVKTIRGVDGFIGRFAD